jgi:regulator of sigma E protease
MEAGLQVGDQLIAIDGQRILAAREANIYINQGAKEDQVVDVTFKREGEKDTLSIQPDYIEERASYLIGISYAPIDKTPFNIIKYGAIECLSWIKMVFYSLRVIFTGQASMDAVAGPVGIVNVIGQGYAESVQYGILSVIGTLSFYVVLLSANLGVMNLLPIPALDGARIIFLLIELVRGKPVDQEKEGFVHMIGFVLLMLLMVFILYNDLRNLIF